MLNSFYKKFSLYNLKKDKPQGQVATLLILMIVVILIMILTTVNLGQLSLSATNLSNVADSSSLYLASQLATRSYALYRALGYTTCKCQKVGLASTIFAMVFAIVAIIVTWGAATPYVIAAAAAAGAAGGAIGGAYAGTGVLQGTLQGLMVGAAIGAGAELGAGVGAGMGAPNAAAAGEVAETGAMGTAGVDANAEAAAWGYEAPPPAPGVGAAPLNAYNAAFNSAIAPYIITGTAIGATLASGASTYNAYVTSQNQAEAIAAASRSLNGLPEYDSDRESVFLQVFSQTVDDPNKDTDTSDLNGNGIINEKVPHFLYWWDGRIKHLKGVIPTLTSITNTFFNGTLQDFNSYIQNAINTGMLSEAGSNNANSDGSIAKVARALNPAFWDANNDGSFNGIVSGFNAFLSQAEAIQAINVNQLTSNWQTYIQNFYNENAGRQVEDGTTITDYYTLLGEVKGYLENWETQIVAARNALPSCKMGSLSSATESGTSSCEPCNSTYCSNDCIVNSGPEMSPMPCKFDFTPQGGSVDWSIDDEITAALNDINTLISTISTFQDTIQQYAKDMANTYAAIESGFGGLNPATYSWTDSRGNHSITASVGNYQLASTITTESGNWLNKEICVRLINYSDDGSNSWVQITRQDPPSKDVKTGRVSLGMWNPFFSGTITKKGKASYSFDAVGLAGK